MKKHQIIRAWKDPEFRRSLSPEEQALLPAHPSALIDVDTDELRAVSGGGFTDSINNSCIASLCTPCPPRHCF